MFYLSFLQDNIIIILTERMSDMWFLQPGMTIPRALLIIAASLFIVFFIMPLHEFAHGYVAYKLGDNTAKYSGRLTLNPLSHISPLGTAAIILFGFGWAKPVQVDPRNFKNPKVGMALVSAAGPLSNFIVAFLGAFILNAFLTFGSGIPYTLVSYIFIFLYYFVSINVCLAVFNLIPLPPLDGSKILAVFLPDRILEFYYRYQGSINLAVFFLLFMGVLSGPLIYINNIMFKWILNISAVPFKIFS